MLPITSESGIALSGLISVWLDWDEDMREAAELPNELAKAGNNPGKLAAMAAQPASPAEGSPASPVDSRQGAIDWGRRYGKNCMDAYSPAHPGKKALAERATNRRASDASSSSPPFSHDMTM